MKRLEYDLAVLNEIHDQVKTAQGDSKKDGNAAKARLDQRRSRREEMSDGDALDMLKQGGFI